MSSQAASAVTATGSDKKGSTDTIWDDVFEADQPTDGPRRPGTSPGTAGQDKGRLTSGADTSSNVAATGVLSTDGGKEQNGEPDHKWLVRQLYGDSDEEDGQVGAGHSDGDTGPDSVGADHEVAKLAPNLQGPTVPMTATAGGCGVPITAVTTQLPHNGHIGPQVMNPADPGWWSAGQPQWSQHQKPHPHSDGQHWPSTWPPPSPYGAPPGMLPVYSRPAVVNNWMGEYGPPPSQPPGIHPRQYWGREEHQTWGDRRYDNRRDSRGSKHKTLPRGLVDRDRSRDMDVNRSRDREKDRSRDRSRDNRHDEVKGRDRSSRETDRDLRDRDRSRHGKDREKSSRERDWSKRESYDKDRYAQQRYRDYKSSSNTSSRHVYDHWDSGNHGRSRDKREADRRRDYDRYDDEKRGSSEKERSSSTDRSAKKYRDNDKLTTDSEFDVKFRRERESRQKDEHSKYEESSSQNERADDTKVEHSQVSLLDQQDDKDHKSRINDMSGEDSDSETVNDEIGGSENDKNDAKSESQSKEVAKKSETLSDSSSSSSSSSDSSSSSSSSSGSSSDSSSNSDTDSETEEVTKDPDSTFKETKEVACQESLVKYSDDSEEEQVLTVKKSTVCEKQDSTKETTLEQKDDCRETDEKSAVNNVTESDVVIERCAKDVWNCARVPTGMNKDIIDDASLEKAVQEAILDDSEITSFPLEKEMDCMLYGDKTLANSHTELSALSKETDVLSKGPLVLSKEADAPPEVPTVILTEPIILSKKPVVLSEALQLENAQPKLPLPRQVVMKKIKIKLKSRTQLIQQKTEMNSDNAVEAKSTNRQQLLLKSQSNVIPCSNMSLSLEKDLQGKPYYGTTRIPTKKSKESCASVNTVANIVNNVSSIVNTVASTKSGVDNIDMENIPLPPYEPKPIEFDQTEFTASPAETSSTNVQSNSALSPKITIPTQVPKESVLNDGIVVNSDCTTDVLGTYDVHESSNLQPANVDVDLVQPDAENPNDMQDCDISLGCVDIVSSEQLSVPNDCTNEPSLKETLEYSINALSDVLNVQSNGAISDENVALRSLDEKPHQNKTVEIVIEEKNASSLSEEEKHSNDNDQELVCTSKSVITENGMPGISSDNKGSVCKAMELLPHKEDSNMDTLVGEKQCSDHNICLPRIVMKLPIPKPSTDKPKKTNHSNNDFRIAQKKSSDPDSVTSLPKIVIKLPKPKSKKAFEKGVKSDKKKSRSKTPKDIPVLEPKTDHISNLNGTGSAHCSPRTPLDLPMPAFARFYGFSIPKDSVSQNLPPVGENGFNDTHKESPLSMKSPDGSTVKSPSDSELSSLSGLISMTSVKEPIINGVLSRDPRVAARQMRDAYKSRKQETVETIATASASPTEMKIMDLLRTSMESAKANAQFENIAEGNLPLAEGGNSGAVANVQSTLNNQMEAKKDAIKSVVTEVQNNKHLEKEVTMEKPVQIVINSQMAADNSDAMRPKPRKHTKWSQWKEKHSIGELYKGNKDGLTVLPKGVAVLQSSLADLTPLPPKIKKTHRPHENTNNSNTKKSQETRRDKLSKSTKSDPELQLVAEVMKKIEEKKLGLADRQGDQTDSNIAVNKSSNSENQNVVARNELGDIAPIEHAPLIHNSSAVNQEDPPAGQELISTNPVKEAFTGEQSKIDNDEGEPGINECADPLPKPSEGMPNVEYHIEAEGPTQVVDVPVQEEECHPANINDDNEEREEGELGEDTDNVITAENQNINESETSAPVEEWESEQHGTSLNQAEDDMVIADTGKVSGEEDLQGFSSSPDIKKDKDNGVIQEDIVHTRAQAVLQSFTRADWDNLMKSNICKGKQKRKVSKLKGMPDFTKGVSVGSSSNLASSHSSSSSSSSRASSGSTTYHSSLGTEKSQQTKKSDGEKVSSANANTSCSSLIQLSSENLCFSQKASESNVSRSKSEGSSRSGSHSMNSGNYESIAPENEHSVQDSVENGKETDRPTISDETQDDGSYQDRRALQKAQYEQFFGSDSENSQPDFDGSSHDDTISKPIYHPTINNATDSNVNSNLKDQCCQRQCSSDLIVISDEQEDDLMSSNNFTALTNEPAGDLPNQNNNDILNKKDVYDSYNEDESEHPNPGFDHPFGEHGNGQDRFYVYLEKDHPNYTEVNTDEIYISEDDKSPHGEPSVENTGVDDVEVISDIESEVATGSENEACSKNGNETDAKHNSDDNEVATMESYETKHDSDHSEVATIESYSAMKQLNHCKDKESKVYQDVTKSLNDEPSHSQCLDQCNVCQIARDENENKVEYLRADSNTHSEIVCFDHEPQITGVNEKVEICHTSSSEREEGFLRNDAMLNSIISDRKNTSSGRFNDPWSHDSMSGPHCDWNQSQSSEQGMDGNGSTELSINTCPAENDDVFSHPEENSDKVISDQSDQESPGNHTFQACGPSTSSVASDMELIANKDACKGETSFVITDLDFETNCTGKEALGKDDVQIEVHNQQFSKEEHSKSTQPVIVVTEDEIPRSLCPNTLLETPSISPNPQGEQYTDTISSCKQDVDVVTIAFRSENCDTVSKPKSSILLKHCDKMCSLPACRDISASSSNKQPVTGASQAPSSIISTSCVRLSNKTSEVHSSAVSGVISRPCSVAPASVFSPHNAMAGVVRPYSLTPIQQDGPPGCDVDEVSTFHTGLRNLKPETNRSCSTTSSGITSTTPTSIYSTLPGGILGRKPGTDALTPHFQMVLPLDGPPGMEQVILPASIKSSPNADLMEKDFTQQRVCTPPTPNDAIHKLGSQPHVASMLGIKNEWPCTHPLRSTSNSTRGSPVAPSRHQRRQYITDSDTDEEYEQGKHSKSVSPDKHPHGKQKSYVNPTRKHRSRERYRRNHSRHLDTSEERHTKKHGKSKRERSQAKCKKRSKSTKKRARSSSSSDTTSSSSHRRRHYRHRHSWLSSSDNSSDNGDFEWHKRRHCQRHCKHCHRRHKFDPETEEFFHKRALAGYCFVEFPTPEAATHAMLRMSGKVVPGSNPAKRFKLNHASYGKEHLLTPEYSLFVGDLSEDVDDLILFNAFFKKFPSCKAAKVVHDNDCRSRGYGFVRFTDEADQQRALVEMQNHIGIGTKPIRVSPATPKRPAHQGGSHPGMANLNQPNYWPGYYGYGGMWTPQGFNSAQSGYGGFGSYAAQGQYSQDQSESTSNAQAADYQDQAENLDEDEVLEDPLIPINIDKANKEFMEQSEEFYVALEGSRWHPLDNVMSTVTKVH